MTLCLCCVGRSWYINLHVFARVSAFLTLFQWNWHYLSVLCNAEIDGLDPQKREMLEARIAGRVSCYNISNRLMCGCV